MCIEKLVSFVSHRCSVGDVMYLLWEYAPVVVVHVPV
jgi:hypothetical protein